MRLLQVHTFYDQYLQEFYRKRPHLLQATFQTQLQTLIDDGFGGGHIFAPALREIGYDAHLVIANDIISQYRWARDHDVTLAKPENWRRELLGQQVQLLQPELLYLNDPIAFDSRFIRSLSWRPKFVFGWRAAPVAPDTDWSEFDLILSHLTVSRRQALQLGAKNAEHFFPAFPPFIAGAVQDEPKAFDVVFVGQWSPQHTQRNSFIAELVQAASGTAGFSLGLFLAALASEPPPAIAKANRGERWGMDMFRALRSARIAVNAESDLNRGEAGNMRLFETVGVGTLLLTEHQENIRQYFEPGTEIETFRNKAELIEKIRFFLAHPEKREAIARAGQKRCLEEYSLKSRVVALDTILRRHLGLNRPIGPTSLASRPTELVSGVGGSRAPLENTLKNIAEHVVQEFGGGANDRALSLLEEAIRQHGELPGLVFGKAVGWAREGRIEQAVEALRGLLAAHPGHVKAAFLLEELKSMKSTSGTNEKSCSANPESVLTLMGKAADLLNKGQAVNAMRVAEQAASLGHAVAGMHYLRTICLNAVGRHEEALAAAQSELRINPDHKEAQAQVAYLTKALVKPKPRKIRPEQRPWGTTLPRETLHAIQNASHTYSYRGIPMIKNPFDFQIYPLLVWKVKPRTIVEVGSKDGASALWLADMLGNFGIDGRVHSVDIVRVERVSHPRVTFLEGNGRALHETFTREFLESLPRPLLVIEDADHSFETSKHVLDFFHPILDKDEFIVVEDGIISDLSNDSSFNSGPHGALKAFLAAHPGEYHIDEEYCDYFGYNVTWNTNGYLKKLTPRAPREGVGKTPALTASIRTEAVDVELAEVLPLVCPWTTLSQESLGAVATLAKKVCAQNTPGNLVVCGSNSAGAAVLLAHVVLRHSRQPRLVHWVEPCGEGDSLKSSQADLTDSTRSAQARKSRGQPLEEIAAKLGVQGVLRRWSSDFGKGFLRLRDQLGMVAMLQIDRGPQDSMQMVLESLYGRVVDDGILVFERSGELDTVIHEIERAQGTSFDFQNTDQAARWCAKPERFPINPCCPKRLVEEFSQDDPMSAGVLSQMSTNERFQIFYAVRELLPRRDKAIACFIEVGSYAGASLALIHRALKRTSPLVQGIAVEPAGQPQFFEVLKRLSGEAVHIPALSHEAAPHLTELFKKDGDYPLLIMIDGDHSYQGVRQDILDYYPMLAPGGIMVFHDYLPALNEENREAIFYHHANQEPGIRRACSELMEQSFDCETLEIPLLRPTDPTQTQAHLPIIPGVYSTIRAYRKLRM